MSKNLEFTLAVIFLVTLVFVNGCASKSGSPQQVAGPDWEWVPSVWVEDNSFTGNQFSRCSYDQSTDYYICPPGTK